MARVPFSGQSRYTDQLLQSVLTPTVVSNTNNGLDFFYSLQTDLCATTVHAGTVYADTVNTSNLGLGDLADQTLALGCQALQGVYDTKKFTTVVGVRAAGNNNFRGTFDGNVLIGAETGLNLCNTDYSTYVGAKSGLYGQATSNVVVGYGACVGVSGVPTVGNVIVGAGAGLSNTGNSNVFIGLNAGANVTVSNTLIVHNTSASVNPLLYGKFDSRQLGVNCVPTRNFQVSGSTLLNGDLTVSGNIAIAGSLSGLTTLGINCIPTTTFEVSGNAILKDLSAADVLTRTLGVNYVPTINTDPLGSTFGVAGNSFFDGDVTVNGTITGFLPPTEISGFAENLHGGGNGYYGGVGLFDTSMTLSGNISNISSTSNYIGGVYLTNKNISLDLSGAITTFSNTSNRIGGVTLSGGRINLSGSISNLPPEQSYIGGVYLQAGNISLGENGRITTFSNTSNRIGGVTLSGGDMILVGNNSIGIGAGNVTLSGGSFSNHPILSDNNIGGVRLYYGSITATRDSTIAGVSITSNGLGGAISNGVATNNTIGGVNMHSCNISASNIFITGNYSTFPGGATWGSNRLFFSNICFYIGMNDVTIRNSGIDTDPLTYHTLGGVTLTNGTITSGYSKSNSIGGVTLSGGVISNESSTSNYIGGVFLGNSNISNISSSTNYIGGVYLDAGELSATRLTANAVRSGTLMSLSTTSNYIGGVTLSNKNISLDPTGSITTFSNTSNYIGGVTLSGGVISNISSTSNYIGGVHLLSNSISLVPSGTITTFSDTSNRIGGVTLSGSLLSCDRIGAGSATIAGTTLSLDGIRCPFAIIGNDPGSENRIGGVFLQNSNISFDGRITNLSNTSNRIGGVHLLSNNISLGSSGAITTFSNTSNYIGGVHLLSNNISLNSTGAITTFSNTSNRIGGIRLNSGILSTGDGVSKCMIVGDQFLQVVGNNGCNRFVFDSSGSEFRACNATPLGTFSLDSLTGNISNASSSSNTIGGITLSSGVITGNGIGLSNISGGVIVGPVATASSVKHVSSFPTTFLTPGFADYPLLDGFYLFSATYSSVFKSVTGIFRMNGGVLTYPPIGEGAIIVTQVLNGQIRVSNTVSTYTCIVTCLRLTI